MIIIPRRSEAERGNNGVVVAHKERRLTISFELMPLRMSLRSRWVTVRPLSFSNQSPAKGRKKKESYNNVNKWIESTFQGRKGHDRDRRLLSPCWTWANPPWCSGPPGMSFSTITRWRNDTWPCQSGHCGTPATKPRTSSQQTPPSPPPVFLLPPLLWGFVGINVFTNLCYIIFSLSYAQIFRNVLNESEAIGRLSASKST